jgi:hypothetical protein
LKVAVIIIFYRSDPLKNSIEGELNEVQRVLRSAQPSWEERESKLKKFCELVEADSMSPQQLSKQLPKFTTILKATIKK